MFKNPFSFRGRIRRTEFAVSYLIVVLYMFCLGILIDQLEIEGFPVLVPLMAIYWFMFSQGAKRCHDLGNSGFFQIIPFYVFAMVFSEGQNRRNKYGQDPKLVELQEKEFVLSTKSKGIVFPEGKQMETIGSELLSGVLLTTLSVVLLSYFFEDNGWLYLITESILIMSGYYLVLFFGFKLGALPKLTRYFLLHRAVFSASCYLCIWGYQVYSNNNIDINFATIGININYIVSIFILTYIPYLIFKTKTSPSPIPLEV